MAFSSAPVSVPASRVSGSAPAALTRVCPSRLLQAPVRKSSSARRGMACFRDLTSSSTSRSGLSSAATEASTRRPWSSATAAKRDTAITAVPDSPYSANRMSPASDAASAPSTYSLIPPSIRMPFSARMGSAAVSSCVSAGVSFVTRCRIWRNSGNPRSVPPTEGDAGPPVASSARDASTRRPSEAAMVKTPDFSILAASKPVNISPPASVTA